MAAMLVVSLLCALATQVATPSVHPLPAAGTTLDMVDTFDRETAAAARAQVHIALVTTLVQLSANLLIMSRVFRLPVGKAFAPWGALFVPAAVTLAIGWFVVRPYLVEGFMLPTGSMAPTLVSGDHVAANKLRQPRRWDVVVYHHSNGRQTQTFCKRVVALPGERLVFDGNGGVTINGVPVPVPPVLAGRCHAAPAGPARSMAKFADGETITMSDRQMFLIGDNVDLSYDSRMDGPSDIASIIGVVDAIYWPPSHVRVMGW
jgi:signal peptidase I